VHDRERGRSRRRREVPDSLELQRDLAAANKQVPIIFITAHGDIPMTVQAMKGGAVEFLTKPLCYRCRTMNVIRYLN
jgi:FixJ family two-component response regulator